MDYSYIIIPIIVVVASQALKLLTDGIAGNFDIKSLFISYGGMPSAHTAVAVSITTLIALRFGVAAPLFAVALVFTLLVMRDAVSFRKILGEQSAILNRVIAILPADKRSGLPALRERMGHSGLEVFVGALWGGVLTYLLNLLV